MQIRKWLLPLIAFLGILFSVYMVAYTSRRLPTPPVAYPPPNPPYSAYIAGSGVIESASENISIGTPFNEIVEAVFVRPGDLVEKGSPLFQLNTERLEKEKQEALFRYEKAQALFEKEKARFSFYENLTDKRAVSEEAYAIRFYALLEAKMQMQAEKKAVEVLTTDIERSLIKAPFKGQVLQVNIRVGENADQNPFRQNERSLLLFGKVDVFHIRVDIDESDAWRYQPNSPGCAFVRGNSAIKIPLHIVRVEPYVVPKKALTGSSIERIDTRVLQVIYQFEKADYPVYVGEIMDVYIQAEKRE